MTDNIFAILEGRGAQAIMLKFEGTTIATVSLADDESGKATDIFIMRNPEKLTNLGTVALH